MPVTIHPTAAVHPKARLGADVQIGPGAVVAERVEIGDRTRIGPHVVVEDWTVIGEENRIFTGAILGSEAQDKKYKGQRAFLRVGHRNTIREYTTFNRATGEERDTVVGDGNLIMAYAHVAHDCMVGSHNVLANGIAMGGHVTIQEHVTIGGLCALHQFVRIGSYAMIGGLSRVTKDVPPYIMCAGSPPRIVGINKIGLERKDFTAEQIRHIEHAYRILYRSKQNVSMALTRLEEETPHEEVRPFIAFIKSSSRGISK